MNPVDNYIMTKPEPWRSMLIELQSIIKHTIPEVTESYKWGLPFYSLHGKMFCFLNFRKKFIDVGFPWGIYISVHQGDLVAGEKRKNLRSLRYFNQHSINVEKLQDVLKDIAFNRKE